MTKKFFIACFAILLFNCKSFYQVNNAFNKKYEAYEFEKASEILLKNKKKNEKDKNRLIHFINLGITYFQLGQYKESNLSLEKAFQIHRTMELNIVKESLAYVINPTVTDYKGEDHEILLIHYYKALNYLALHDIEKALIECNRMNNELKRLKTRYKSKAKFTKDAFIYALMGMIFQANNQFNEAFISYRNAEKIYEKEYPEKFGVKVPIQLIKDLIYTAKLMGFHEEADNYQRKYNIKVDTKEYADKGSLVCLWNNGLGPVKDELSINFVIVPGVGGVVNFQNDELGLTFPFPMPPVSGGASVTDMQFIRVAFPKYVERKQIYTQGTLSYEGKTYDLEIAENINAISFLVLKQRMVWELSKTLMRLAVKKVTEYMVSRQNAILGLGVGIFNMATEKADTRNISTIPHSIYYSRIPIKKGKNKVIIEVGDNNYSKSTSKEIEIDIINKETKFYYFNTLEYQFKK